MTPEVPDPSGPGQLLVGRQLYSPGTVAAFALLTSLPVAYVLHGLNLKALGIRRLGVAWVWFGSACFVLPYAVPQLAPALKLFMGLGAFGAISLFQIESPAFTRGLRQGATRAPWWPPALVVLAIMLIVLVLDFTLAAAAA